jgi:tetratricopeptide (TPR) repeat protein
MYAGFVLLGLLLLVGLVLAVAALVARPREQNHVGRKMVFKGPGVRFAERDADGRFLPGGILNVPVVEVTARQGDWLGVWHAGRELWVVCDVAIPVDEAPGYFSELIRRDPGHVAARVWRGLAWDALDRPGSARADYRATLEFDPTVWRAFFDREGQDWFTGTADDRALADWGEVVRRHPAWADGYLGRGTLWACRGDLDQALLDYTTAVRVDAGDALAVLYLAQARYFKQDYEQTIRDCTEAVRLDPQLCLAYSFRGMAHHAQGRYDEAIREYDAAIARGSRRPADFLNRGIVWYGQGEYDRAAADFSGALDIDPGRTEAYFYRGQCRALRHEYTSAVEDLSIAAQRDGPSPYPLYWRAKVYWAQKNYSWAAQDLEAALQRSPDEPWGLNFLAWLRATCPDSSQRDGRKSIEYATAACTVTGWKLWWVIDTLAAAHAEAGDLAQAVRYQQQVLDAPELPEHHRGEARRTLEQYQRGQPYRDLEPWRTVPESAGGLIRSEDARGVWRAGQW